MTATTGFDIIHIIESLPESDGNPGKELADRLNADSSVGVPVLYHFVFDANDLAAAMNAILGETPRQVPALHFEVHGNESGFGLRSGEFVHWKDFGATLWAINRASDFNLLVVWSCCFGINQIAAMGAFQPSPFVGVVGCDQTAYTNEMLTGFAVFYPALISSGNRNSALAALQAKITSGAKFGFFTVTDAFQGAYKLVRDQNSSKAAIRARAKSIRAQLALDAKQRRIANQKVSNGQIEHALKLSEPKTLLEFYEAFFACAEFPANRKRFPFKALSQGL